MDIHATTGFTASNTHLMSTSDDASPVDGVHDSIVDSKTFASPATFGSSDG